MKEQYLTTNNLKLIHSVYRLVLYIIYLTFVYNEYCDVTSDDQNSD